MLLFIHIQTEIIILYLGETAIMAINLGFAPVGASQKVGRNQNLTDPKKAFTVAWDKSTATIAQVVGIRGIANIGIENPGLVTVTVFYNDHPYKAAENVQITPEGKITAQWKVIPYKVGAFAAGQYDVQINYGGGGFSGKTTFPLKIVPVGGDRNVSSFGWFL